MPPNVDSLLREIAEAEVRKAVDAEIQQALDTEVTAHAERIIREGLLPAAPDIMEAESDIDNVAGIDWGDIGKGAMGVVHSIGKPVLSAFGAGAIAQSLETAESDAGILPEWAGGKAVVVTVDTKVTGPDFVILVRQNGQSEVMRPTHAVVHGGTLFAGNGYKHGDPFGKKFSFGFNMPASIDIYVNGQKQSTDGLKQVLFCGGAGDRVAGQADEDIVGDAFDTSKWSAGDWAATLFTGGAYGVAKSIDQMARDSAGTPVLSTSDWSQSTAGKAFLDPARAKLVAAQAARDAAAAKLAAGRGGSGYVASRPDVPSFSLPGSDFTFPGSSDMTTTLGEAGYDGDEAGNGDIDILGDVGNHYTEIIGGPSDTDIVGAERPIDPYLVGTCIIGAAPPKKLTSKQRGGKNPHVQMINKGPQVVAKVTATAKRAGQKAASYDAKTHHTIIGLVPFVVHGDVVLGTDRKLTAVQSRAVAKHVDAIKRHAAAAKDTKAKANKAAAAAGDLGAFLTKNGPTLSKFLKRSGKSPQNVKIKGLDDSFIVPDDVTFDEIYDEVFGHTLLGDMPYDKDQIAIVQKTLNRLGFRLDADGILGPGTQEAIRSVQRRNGLPETGTLDGSVWQLLSPAMQSVIGAPTDPDPLNPGYLIDGTIDPGGGNPYGGTAPAGGVPIPPPYDASTDPDITPLPVRDAAVDLNDTRYFTNDGWSTPPEDAVLLDWNAHPPSVNYSTGSLSYYKGGPGFVANTSWNGYDEYYDNGGHNDENNRGSGSGGDIVVNARSIPKSFGPLVGNPGTASSGEVGKRIGSGSGGDWAGMQMARNGQWFWPADLARSWATKEADHILDLANQKIIAAKTAEANARIAEANQTNAQIAEDQAKQDAANALAMSQASTQADITAAAQGAQQSQMEMEMQRQLQQFQAQQAQLSLEQQKAQAGLMQQAQQADLDWAVAHPEALMQPQQQQDDGDGDEGDGVDWGAPQDDGLPQE